MKDVGIFYPALTGSKTPISRYRETTKIDGGLTTRKSPIGSTNHQWEMKKTSTDGVSLYRTTNGKLNQIPGNEI